MNSELYPMIYKRKSFHQFRNVGNASITQTELKEIRAAYRSFESLYPEIRIDMGIFLCFLDLCLEQDGIRTVRKLYTDMGGTEEFTKTAEYTLLPKIARQVDSDVDLNAVGEDFRF